MIAYTNLHPMLINSFPSLRKFNYPSTTLIREFALLNYFTDISLDALQDGEYKFAEECLSKAVEIYNDGDVLLRRLIKGVVFEGFDCFYKQCTKAEQEDISRAMSANLLKSMRY